MVVEGPGSAELIKEVKRSFAADGITSLLFMPVTDVTLLTFAAQNLLAMCDVVVGGAVLVNDSGLGQTLVGGLVQLGLISASCVIPAVVSQSSLLEAKAILPALAESWARACKAALVVQAGSIKVSVEETPAPPAPVVVTEAVDSVQDLLTAFKQSLKVSPANSAVLCVVCAHVPSLPFSFPTTLVPRRLWHRRHQPQIPHRRRRQQRRPLSGRV